MTDDTHNDTNNCQNKLPQRHKMILNGLQNNHRDITTTTTNTPNDHKDRELQQLDSKSPQRQEVLQKRQNDNKIFKMTTKHYYNDHNHTQINTNSFKNHHRDRRFYKKTQNLH